MSLKDRFCVSSFSPLGDKVFVTDLDRGPQRTASGLILPDDDMTERGIRPRWGRVYAIGPDVVDVKVGEWVLVEHARWSERLPFEINGEPVMLWQVEFPKSVLAVADEDPRNNEQIAL